MTRRVFGKVLLPIIAAGSTGAASLLSELIPLQLTKDEEETLIRLARENHHGLEFGEHPDFERQQLHGALDTMSRAQTQVPGMKFVGTFGYLEEFAYYPENKEVLRQRIRAIHSMGLVPLIGLGPGGTMDPHPLHIKNDAWIKHHIDEWLEFLSSFDSPVHVRWLFETNLIVGDIAHKATPALSGQAHIDRVRYLSEYFDTRRKLEKYDGKVFYHAAFAAAGYDFAPYLADCDYDGVGLDVYPDIHGIRMVRYAIAQLLGWKNFSIFPQTMLCDLQTQANIYGIKSYLYEYSPLENLDWMKYLLLAHYGHGGSGDMTFGINKVVTEGKNWTISEEARQLRVLLHVLFRRQ